jgi:hypothetical protein
VKALEGETSSFVPNDLGAVKKATGTYNPYLDQEALATQEKIHNEGAEVVPNVEKKVYEETGAKKHFSFGRLFQKALDSAHQRLCRRGCGRRRHRRRSEFSQSDQRQRDLRLGHDHACQLVIDHRRFGIGLHERRRGRCPDERHHVFLKPLYPIVEFPRRFLEPCDAFDFRSQELFR